MSINSLSRIWTTDPVIGIMISEFKLQLYTVT